MRNYSLNHINSMKSTSKAVYNIVISSMMRYTFVLVFALSAICYASALKVDFNHKEPRHKDCIGHGFGAGQIALLNRGDAVDPNCPEYSRHLRCIWKQMGVMNEDGVLQESVIVEKIADFSDDDQNDIITAKSCISQKNTQNKTANEFYHCIRLLIKKYNSY